MPPLWLLADPMNLWQKFHLAQTIEDALQALVEAPGDARLIAGGTDLLLDLQQGRHSPVHTLVDVTRIPELNALEIREKRLFIGAGVPHRKIIESPLVDQHAHALSVACGLIGGPQVRNTATLGGNVAHALPAGDGTIALLALDAQAEIAGPAGCHRVPVQDLFLGPGKSSLENEILVGFYLPLQRPGEASAFRRIMRPQGVAIAILNLAVWLRREDERIADVRIAVGPSGPVPRRMLAAENVLRGQILNAGVIAEAYQALLSEARFRTSPQRATKEYRVKMAGVLLEETLMDAFERSGAESSNVH